MLCLRVEKIVSSDHHVRIHYSDGRRSGSCMGHFKRWGNHWTSNLTFHSTFNIGCGALFFLNTIVYSKSFTTRSKPSIEVILLSSFFIHSPFSFHNAPLPLAISWFDWFRPLAVWYIKEVSNNPKITRRLYPWVFFHMSTLNIAHHRT